MSDDSVNNPLTYKQTINDVDRNQWINVMDLKMEWMYFNFLWELIYQPNRVKHIRCKLIYTENEMLLEMYRPSKEDL